MWDNPRLLNLAAGTLVGIAVFVFAIVGVALLARSPLFPVTQIELTHPLGRTTRAEVESAARAYPRKLLRGIAFGGARGTRGAALGAQGLGAPRLAGPAGSEPRGARRV